jgi:hypothetical protein
MKLLVVESRLQCRRHLAGQQPHQAAVVVVVAQRCRHPLRSAGNAVAILFFHFHPYYTLILCTFFKFK